MNNEQFVEIVNARCDSIKAVLANKAKEYAADDDRLHNFKRAALIGRTNPSRALFGMMNKHLVSVLDIFDDIDRGILPSEAMVDEKFGDLINYLILELGVIAEMRTKE